MKKLLSTLLILTLVLALSGCGQLTSQPENNANNGNANSVENPPAGTGSTTLVQPKKSEVDAKSIAFAHAGITQADVKNLQAELDRDDGVLSYEIEFHVGNVAYDYDIDAKTGEIIKAEKDGKDVAASVPTKKITREAAKLVALNHAGVKEADVRELEIELDTENGILIYEIDFRVGNIEYDYDIDAKASEIIKAEKDGKQIAAAAPTNKITKEAAKQVALDHAGAKQADVRGYEIGLDLENGVLIYEIEFFVGNIEYEYDIDAKTGEILRVEKDGEDVAPVAPTNKITAEQAKQVAFDHAGVKQADIRDLDIELDIEKGVLVYEVSFDANGFEYDYEINAETKAIIRSEKEKDD